MEGVHILIYLWFCKHLSAVSPGMAIADILLNKINLSLFRR